MKRLEVKIGEDVKFQKVNEVITLVAVEDTSSGGCSLCWFEKKIKQTAIDISATLVAELTAKILYLK